jgi:carbamate kinase
VERLRVVAGLGGNALLQRGEPLTQDAQRHNVSRAAAALAAVARDHELVVTHGNGPQVGLLALQDTAVPGLGGFTLDVLSAETAGMIGYLLARELRGELPDRQVVSLLTQVEVDREDPAFRHPHKPVGPSYTREQAQALARAQGWSVGRGSDGYRRVVSSPRPLRVLEIDAVRLLLEAGMIVICAGGGGIPVTVDPFGRVHGVDAVVDKDPSTALVAEAVGADALLLLTDVEGLLERFGTPRARVVRQITPAELRSLDLPEGSMGPKAEAAASFVERTGGFAAIGSLTDASAMLRAEAGTRVEAPRSVASTGPGR